MATTGVGLLDQEKLQPPKDELESSSQVRCPMFFPLSDFMQAV